ncbi:MAG: OmpH family outer membrane protein [Alphaproteobacteria bacterium]|nr:OmpH family outer membrane protein [Alphaproteobacteria bacterium]
MANNKNTVNPAAKKYARTGIIAAAVVVVAALGIWAVFSMSRGGASVNKALGEVSSDAVTAADLRMAVIRMDAIQTEANALKDLRKQKENYEEKLRDELTREQKTLEKEKAEIEKSQDVLSRDALQRRIVDYQNRVTGLQRSLTERAQSIDAAYQKALNDLQTKHLDPIIEGVIAKKNLSLVIDGRFARVGANAEKLDITDEVIKALNKKISSVKMEKPKGF